MRSEVHLSSSSGSVRRKTTRIVLQEVHTLSGNSIARHNANTPPRRRLEIADFAAFVFHSLRRIRCTSPLGESLKLLPRDDFELFWHLPSDAARRRQVDETRGRYFSLDFVRASVPHSSRNCCSPRRWLLIPSSLSQSMPCLDWHSYYLCRTPPHT